jgi:4-hydroxybutyrate CoA-transferase
LAEALYQRKDELHDVTISSGTTTWMLPFYTEEPGGPFSVQTYFAGPAERQAMKRHNCKYTSLHLSQVDQWCREIGKPTVAFIEVSPPDDFGYMCYGAFGPAMHDDVRQVAKKVVLQVNENAPYVFGQRCQVHVSDADLIVEATAPLAEVPDAPFDDTMCTISQFIVDEIPDGANIQLGLGGVSGAVGFGLEQKNDLGVHTEMLTNSMMHLMEMGVITNKKKNYMPNVAVAAFALGSKDLYRFVDHNPRIIFAPFTFANNPATIAKNDNMISVNTAMCIDLFGQVAADAIDGHQQSGVGGQVDYVRGAQMSKGGKSFIALPSTMESRKGRHSKIVATLSPGTTVTTSRQDVQYVVTEYGCVNLKPLSMQDRARVLISLAHPDFRDELTDQAKELGLM